MADFLTLKGARICADLTRKQAAKQLGISESTLLNYENGTSSPRISTVKDMERVYSLKLVELYFKNKFTV